MSNVQLYACQICGTQLPDLDVACNHHCFDGCERISLSEDGLLSKIDDTSSAVQAQNHAHDITTDSANVMDTESHQSPPPASKSTEAIWDDNAVDALIAAYENKKDVGSYPSTKRKLWETLAADLREQGIDMTPMQVKWKWSYLLKKYRETMEKRKRKVSGPIQFRYFKKFDEIFGYGSTSKYVFQSMSHREGITNISKSSDKARQSRMTHTTSHIDSKNTSGAPLASRSKIELEKKWIEHLQFVKEHADTIQLHRNEDLVLRENQLLLKKKKMEMLEKVLECREKESAQKLKIKMTMHCEKMMMEEKKLKMLSKMFNI